MKNKSRLLISLLLILGLASCNPNFNDDSKEGSSADTSSDSSEVSSEDSSSHGSEDTSEDSSEGGESESSSDSQSESSEIIEEMEKRCDLMNEYIANKTYFDIFEVKDDLYSNGFEDIISEFSSSKYFGYDINVKKVCIYDTDRVTYPTGASATYFYSYKEKEVNTIGEVNAAIARISAGTEEYSTIKFTNNMTLNSASGLVIDSGNPIEFNLNGMTLDSGTRSGSYFNGYSIKVTNPLAIVAIKNGTIKTVEDLGYHMSFSPSCVSAFKAKTVRITDVNLINQADRGYSFLDSVTSNNGMKVKINECDITSNIVGVCIQKGEYQLLNNNIKGAVVINGGASTLTGNDIDVSNIHNDADRLITCEELWDNCNDCYNTAGRDTYMLTSTDAVLIYDRRSVHSTYSQSSVTLTNNKLKCMGTATEAYGYGIRYMDLNLDPNKTSSKENQIVINTNEYKGLPTGVSDPENAGGGYIFFHKN